MRRRDFVGATLSVAAASCARAGTQFPMTNQTPGTTPLAAFFSTLRTLQAGTRQTPVSVLQIGDSHTAIDAFSGRMRELLQQRFGNAGRGLLPPGIPFKYYKPDNVRVTATGWTVESSFLGGAAGPFGITGLRQHAEGPAEMVLQAERPGDLAAVDLEFLAQKSGGTVSVACDSGPAIDIRTDGPPAQWLWHSIAAPEAARITLSTQGGPVDMMSWRVRRAGPGITWSNLGTIGATVGLLQRWDQAFVHAELARETPDLIVLAFGSNEGFRDDTDPKLYAASYRAAIARLQEGAPQASLLLIGPPDGVRKPHPGAGTLCPGTDWQTPENLPRVRAIQREIAAQSGLFWWDWSAPMGGQCGMVDWAARKPPLGQDDHLHLRHAGYRLTAEALYADLMRDFEQGGP